MPVAKPKASVARAEVPGIPSRLLGLFQTLPKATIPLCTTDSRIVVSYITTRANGESSRIQVVRVLVHVRVFFLHQVHVIVNPFLNIATRVIRFAESADRLR